MKKLIELLNPERRALLADATKRLRDAGFDMDPEQTWKAFLREMAPEWVAAQIRQGGDPSTYMDFLERTVREVREENDPLVSVTILLAPAILAWAQAEPGGLSGVAERATDRDMAACQKEGLDYSVEPALAQAFTDEEKDRMGSEYLAELIAGEYARRGSRH